MQERILALQDAARHSGRATFSNMTGSPPGMPADTMIPSKTNTKAMSREELMNHIRTNPQVFEGMSNDDFQQWVWDNWTQYQDGVNPSANEDAARQNAQNLFGIFSESPLYNIPDEVYQKLDLYSQTALAGVKGAAAARESAMQTMRDSFQASMGTLDTARRDTLNMATQDITRIRDIQERSRANALDQSYAARAEQLATLQKGSDRALDIARLQAFGGLPGERTTREQMASNFAATLQTLRERAGGGSGGSGAVAQAYGGQLAQNRQLAVDRAQYQAQGMSQLAGLEYETSGRMAEAMRQSRMDIAGVEMSTAKDLSNAYMSTSEYYTGLVGDYAKSIADTQFAGGGALANLDVTTAANLRETGFKGAELIGGAYEGVAQQKQQQYALNEFQPYAAQQQFLLGELGRLDPFGVQSQYYGDLIGMGQSQYLSGVEGKASATKNTTNSISNTISNAAIANLLYSG